MRSFAKRTPREVLGWSSQNGRGGLFAKKTSVEVQGWSLRLRFGLERSSTARIKLGEVLRLTTLQREDLTVKS